MKEPIYSRGDLFNDYKIKKKFYESALLEDKNLNKALTLTMCYYNKIKYKCVYNQVREYNIQQIISKYL